MELNKQDEKLLQELLRKYKQGIVSGMYPGTNITFTPTGCRDRLISALGSGGTGSLSIQDITYEDLYELYSNSILVPLQYYRITDFETIYDQSASAVTKTSSSEALIVQASKINSLFPNAFSESFPTDIIIYDISVNTTYINNEPCKGKIIYRESKEGIKAPFDFRKVLMVDTVNSTEETIVEALYFDLSKAVSDVELAVNPSLLQTYFDYEFPVSIITGDCTNVKGLTTVGTLIDGNVSQVSNAVFVGASTKGIVQSTGIKISDSIFSGQITQMTNVDATGCTIAGTSDYCTTGTWTNTTFGEQVNKCLGTNFNASSIGGRIDRLIGSAILTSNVGGRLFWCQNLALFTSDIVGGMQGVNNLTWEGTDANCEIKVIQGMTMFDSQSGFEGCTITGTLAASVFGNIKVECLVQGKTIDQAAYPELFNETYTKIIYKKPNGDIFYRYLDNSNVWVYTQIV